ncbi:MAG: hypothetical protein Q8S31_02955 [Alphaproteobacteria bacterium]|nr:hypothetical protein [Alphaproteobacteria bacterium]
MSISNLIKISLLSLALLSKLSFAGKEDLKDDYNITSGDRIQICALNVWNEFQEILKSNNLSAEDLIRECSRARRSMPSPFENYYPQIAEALKKFAQDTKDDFEKAMVYEEICTNAYWDCYDHNREFVFLECLKILETSKNTKALTIAMRSAIDSCDFKKTEEIGLSNFNSVSCYKDRKGNIYHDPTEFLEQKFIDFWEEFQEILVSNNLSDEALIDECAKALSVVAFLSENYYPQIINVLKRIAKNTKDDLVKVKAYNWINNPCIRQQDTYKDYVFVCKKLFKIIKKSKNLEVISTAEANFNYLTQLEDELWRRWGQSPRVYLSKFIGDRDGKCTIIQ